MGRMQCLRVAETLRYDLFIAVVWPTTTSYFTGLSFLPQSGDEIMDDSIDDSIPPLPPPMPPLSQLPRINGTYTVPENDKIKSEVYTYME